ncbi:MAG TPA: DUF3500 domain-containing protein [Verrucomicrobiota bacterium]|nr:hypothetical protein [Verrucomicrobiales bacterium]HRI15375.1 DUF3500 domain-containing protein [Verrucomicrobiota bacterium]
MPVSSESPRECSCELPAALPRRAFLKTTAAGLALASASRIWLPPAALAAPTAQSASETLASQLFRSLSPEQRALLCFQFDHPLREEIDNNWLITKKPISESLNPDQQNLVQQIYRQLHAPDFVDRAMQQIVHDSEGKGFNGGTSVALFGEPGSGQFEFVVTGRHCTRRCDGDSVAGAAFGGPIFYGHQAGDKDREPSDHPGNVFWYQAKRVNEVFQALDGKQREVALIDGRSRPERATETVRLSRRRDGLSGIPMGSLAADQRGLVRQVLADLLSPFRAADSAEALKLMDAQGLDDLHLAFFKQQDMGNDGVWDVWQIEGPNMLWYFRGEPHVHCWVHIRA